MQAEFRRGAGGFTLLELLMVLMVLALAGVIVYPNLRPHLERTGREADVRKLSAALDDLRRQAVTGGRTLVLSFDAEEGKLLLAGEGSGEEPHEFPLPGKMRLRSMVPDRLYYFPQGHASGAVLETGGEAERLVRIEVGSFTGLSRAVPGEEE